MAASLNNLAALYQVQGRYAEAEPLFKRSLAIKEKAFGPDHPDVALSLNNLGLLYQNQGRYTDAEPLYKRALAIKEKDTRTQSSRCCANRSTIWRSFTGPRSLCRSRTAAKAIVGDTRKKHLVQIIPKSRFR